MQKICHGSVAIDTKYISPNRFITANYLQKPPRPLQRYLFSKDDGSHGTEKVLLLLPFDFTENSIVVFWITLWFQ